MGPSAIAPDLSSASTQMNTRIDRALKEEGDAVLERNGTTPSEAIRSLWRYLAFHNDLPAYMKRERQEALDEERARIRSMAQEAQGLALRVCADMGIALAPTPVPTAPSTTDYKTLRDAMYEEMLDDYLANCR